MASISPPKIAIIGAGPAGLTLARLLHVSQADIDVKIYELDASQTSRPSQGGTLDLHTDTGLAAVRKCGLWESFRKHARYEGSELVLADKNATVLVHMPGGEKSGSFDRPEIGRELLKEMLLESVPADYLRWGWHLREVTEDGMLRFDGREELEGPFDLIVGADGAWSKVRGRLNGLKPAYSGVSGYEIQIKDPPKSCPHVDKMIGRGSFFCPSDNRFITGQRQGNNSIRITTWLLCPEMETKETLEKLGKKGTLEKILEWHADWAPEIVDFFKHGDLDTLSPWQLYELPVGSKWEHKKGLTLIGDAASLMTPFSGEGVNKAMQDSLELAALIEKSQDPNENLTLDQAVMIYEQLMFDRAEKFQAMTMHNKEIFFGPDTPLRVITDMMETVARESPSIPVKMLGTLPVVAAVRGYFWTRLLIGWAIRKFWRRT